MFHHQLDWRVAKRECSTIMLFASTDACERQYRSFIKNVEWSDGRTDGRMNGWEPTVKRNLFHWSRSITGAFASLRQRPGGHVSVAMTTE